MNETSDFVMTDSEEQVYDSVLDLHEYIAKAIDKVNSDIPSSRERSLVITKLQEADMWLSYVPLS